MKFDPLLRYHCGVKAHINKDKTYARYPPPPPPPPRLVFPERESHVMRPRISCVIGVVPEENARK